MSRSVAVDCMNPQTMRRVFKDITSYVHFPGAGAMPLVLMQLYSLKKNR